MAGKSFTLIDSDPAKVSAEQTITAQDVGGAAKDFSIERFTLKSGLSQGVEVIDVNNGRCQIRLLPTRGMAIHSVTVDGVRFGWRSPIRGPVHPAFVDLGEPSGLGWLDGFDELFARCGLDSNGAPEFEQNGKLKYPLHGRIGNKPAHQVTATVDGDEIRIVGVIEEARFHFLKLRLKSTLTIKIGEPKFRITDEVENLSTLPAEFQMLYHINFGLPLLDGGSRVVCAPEKVVPRNAHAAAGLKSWDHYSAPQPGFEEQVYFFKLLSQADGWTHTLLKNAHGTQGASVLYNTKTLPCFSVWKDTAGEADGYVTGLEPATNFPNPRSFEGKAGRVGKLAAGASTALELELQFHTKAAEVTAAEAAIGKLAEGKTPQIFDQPQPDWCA